MEVMIAALTVFCFAMTRFNVPPPSRVTLPTGIPHSIEEARKWLRVKSEPASTILPPPRANTTIFRYWLYRVTYGVIGVVVYLTLYKIDGVRDSIIKLLLVLPGLESLKSVIPADPTPFMIAIVVLLLPMLPLFKVADASIRRALYLRALIPAEQLRLCGCARTAEFNVDAALLEQVRDTLEVEGFDRRDIAYDEKPSTRSLWTKAGLLVRHIQRWEGLDKYKTAFAVLRERESNKRSCEQIREAYEALKGDAKTCFKALREQPEQEETQRREECFRRECKTLLESMYGLLSRVSLHSHYSERERIAGFRELGFQIEPRQGGPVPDINDATCLLILLGMVVILPLWHEIGFTRALAVGSIYFTATLTPLLLAAYCPVFAMGQGARTPAVACPVVAGLIAVIAAVVISVLSKSIMTEFSLIDLSEGWGRYKTGSYPWSFLVFLVAAMISVWIRIGKYPDASRLNGIYRYRQWGSLTDGMIFAVCTAALMIVYIIPRLMELRPEVFTDDDWLRLLLVPTAATFVIGFFVPTWHRANRFRAHKETDRDRSHAGNRPSAHDHSAAV
jgi:hypothetical protein